MSSRYRMKHSTELSSNDFCTKYKPPGNYYILIDEDECKFHYKEQELGHVPHNNVEFAKMLTEILNNKEAEIIVLRRRLKKTEERLESVAQTL
jgi:hypothetical protein